MTSQNHDIGLKLSPKDPFPFHHIYSCEPCLICIVLYVTIIHLSVCNFEINNNYPHDIPYLFHKWPIWHLPTYFSLSSSNHIIPYVGWRIEHRLKINYKSVIDLAHIHSKLTSHHIDPTLPPTPIEHISLVWKIRDDLMLQESLMN